MEPTRFNGLLRAFTKNQTRRWVFAAIGGLGLAAMPDLAGARKKHRKHGPRRGTSRIAAAAKASTDDILLALEGPSDAERVGLFSNEPGAPVWHHSHLTVTVKAVQDEPAKVAAIHQAIAKWSDVLDRHFGGAVTLTDVTDDPHASKTADIKITLTPQGGRNLLTGFAECGDDSCENVFLRSKFPPGQLDPEFPGDITPQFVGQGALHELGHALGLNHATPLYSTDDIMGWGYLPWGFNRQPVLSDCDLKALDEVWAWAVQGVAPYQSSLTEVVCQG